MSKSIPTRPSPLARWTTTTALGAVTWMITSPLVGCAPSDEPKSAEGEGQKTHNEGEGHAEGEGEGEAHAASAHSEGEGERAAASTGEGEGEGEGGSEGEGEGAGPSVDFATDDAAYLTQLGLIRGHLAVGYALYKQGLTDLAQTHMKHPKADTYTDIEPAFGPRGCNGFAGALGVLTDLVTGGEPLDHVTPAYERLQSSITTCEAAANADDPKMIVKVIEDLLRTAGVEYKIGIIDGKVNNLHEYQDAWGFTQVAADWAQASAFGDTAEGAAAAAQIQAIIRDLEPLWPSLDPKDGVEGDAAQLFGAAGRVGVAGAALGR